MRRTLSLLLILALLPTACKREEPPVPQGKRAPRIAAPTRDDIETEHRNELLAKLDPFEKLEVGGVNFETPDGEKWVRYPNGMLVHDLKRNNGAEARWGQTVRIAYTLTLPDAPQKVVDSRKADNPLEFTIGARDIIKGMNIGVLGMQEGGRRRIFVPPELGYGSTGTPTRDVPPNQPLIFEIEVVSITGEALPMPPPVKLPEQLGPPAPATPPATGPAINMTP